jgi:double-stranded uracil-DNA glycosylase
MDQKADRKSKGFPKDAEKTGFASIADRRSIVLILGSLPGDESIRAQEYYAHPRNQFWALIGCASAPSVYEDKKRYLLEKRIALWDTLQRAERTGSLDTKIKNGAPNDFDIFFKTHPDIRHIFFNGQASQKLFLKHERIWADRIPSTLLPSSSPANAQLSFEQKKEAWQAVFKVLAAYAEISEK